MTIKQFVHRTKRPGVLKLKPGKWQNVDLSPCAATGSGRITHHLYLNVSYTGEGVLGVRLVRKPWKRLEADPTGYDERYLSAQGGGNALVRFHYEGPVRSGEVGRPYQWQVRVKGCKSAAIGTRYSDFWRDV